MNAQKQTDVNGQTLSRDANNGQTNFENQRQHFEFGSLHGPIEHEHDNGIYRLRRRAFQSHYR